MAKLYNIARMTTATTGTGTITLASAVSGYLSFAGAGVANADVVFYGIADGSNSEVGYGTYTSAGTTLTRTVIKSTNSNTAISLSGSAQVYITALASDGGDLLRSSTNPLLGFDAPINLQLNASVATNILTVSVKGNNGSDPSSTNPVLIPFRDSTIANGGPVWRAVTAALSINTNATGATLGTASGNVPFRLWVVAFDNAGTVVLALWQSVTGGSTPTSIANLNEAIPSSSTAVSGTATSAGTFYTPNGTTVSSKSYRILGYLDYASGLTTAGTYASGPTKIQLFGPGIAKPNNAVQTVAASTTTADTGTTATSFTGSAFGATITPSSAVNLVAVNFNTNCFASGANTVAARIARGGGSGLTTGTAITLEAAINANGIGPAAFISLDAPGTASAQVYTLQRKTNNAATTAICPYQNTAGQICAYGTLTEIMV